MLFRSAQVPTRGPAPRQRRSASNKQAPRGQHSYGSLVDPVDLTVIGLPESQGSGTAVAPGVYKHVKGPELRRWRQAITRVAQETLGPTWVAPNAPTGLIAVFTVPAPSGAGATSEADGYRDLDKLLASETLLRRLVIHGYSDQVLAQSELFYVLQVPAPFELDTSGFTEEEKLTIAAWDWHSIDQLAALQTSNTAKLEEMGVEITEYDEAIRVVREKPLAKCNIKTMPHPGFPTDMQPLMGVLLSVAKGTSTITESVWDNRFRYVDELRKMGANVQVDGQVAVFEGVDKLTPAPLRALDLRAGAAMVVAALIADGTSEIEEIGHIERGYENIVEKLRGLGADISKVERMPAALEQAL